MATEQPAPTDSKSKMYYLDVAGMGALNQRPKIVLRISLAHCTLERVTTRIKQHFGVPLAQELQFFKEFPLPSEGALSEMEPEYCSLDGQDIVDVIKEHLEAQDYHTSVTLPPLRDLVYVDTVRQYGNSSHATDSNFCHGVDQPGNTPSVLHTGTNSNGELDAGFPKRSGKDPKRGKTHHDWAVALRALWPMNILRCVLPAAALLHDCCCCLYTV